GSDAVPDGNGDRVQIGVRADRSQLFDQPTCGSTALAVNTDLLAEPYLVLGAGDVHVVAVAVAGLPHRLDPGADVEPQEQPCHVVGESSAGRGVVDPAAVPGGVPVHAAVGGPQVAQEQRQLRLGQRPDTVRHELLMAAQPEQS